MALRTRWWWVALLGVACEPQPSAFEATPAPLAVTQAVFEPGAVVEEFDADALEVEDDSVAEDEAPLEPLPVGIPEDKRWDYEECARGSSCTLAEELEHGSMTLDSNPALALTLYERSCAAGADDDCDSAAELLVSGRVGPRDFARGIAFARRACDAKPYLCLTLINLLEFAGPSRDVAAAKSIEQQACLRGAEYLCLAAANRFDEGSTEAKSWLRVGCERFKDEAACRELRER